jgi:hypothetical protein
VPPARSSSRGQRLAEDRGTIDAVRDALAEDTIESNSSVAKLVRQRMKQLLGKKRRRR